MIKLLFLWPSKFILCYVFSLESVSTLSFCSLFLTNNYIKQKKLRLAMATFDTKDLKIMVQICKEVKISFIIIQKLQITRAETKIILSNRTKALLYSLGF